MHRYVVFALVCVLLVSGVSRAQRPASGGAGFTVCVGIERYPLLGDVKGARERAETAGGKLKAANYRFVTVLVDGAKHWEDRATLANIRSQVTQLAHLAGPQDRLVVFFSGHGIMVDGKACLVPAHGDEDNVIPVAWLVETLAASKAGSRFLIVDAGKDVRGFDGSSVKATTGKPVTVLHSKDIPDAAVKGVSPLRKPKPGYGRVRFIMHRKMVMNVWGSTRETWRFNTTTIDYKFEFKRDTHQVVGVAELPAGEYTISQKKWEHWSNYGFFVGGPYAALDRKFRIVAGKEHEIKYFNKQAPLSPHGTGIFWWDGRRICHSHSLTRKVMNDLQIEQHGAGSTSAIPVRTALTVANGQRGAKLYALAMKGYAKALRKAREMGNRILVAQAAKEMAWLLATASDDKFRNTRKALVLAEEAIGLARETQVRALWGYTDTLAAALAGNGKFKAAAKEMKQAVAQAKANKPPVPPHIMKKLEERLGLYQMSHGLPTTGG